MHYNFIKQSNKRYLEELNNRWHEFPVVSNAVNIMQRTEWVINQPVYEVLLACITNGYALGKLPINPEDIPLPPKPHDIATNKCIGTIGIDYLKKNKLTKKELILLNQRAERIGGYLSNFLN